MNPDPRPVSSCHLAPKVGVGVPHFRGRVDRESNVPRSSGPNGGDDVRTFAGAFSSARSVPCQVWFSCARKPHIVSGFSGIIIPGCISIPPKANPIQTDVDSGPLCRLGPGLKLFLDS